MGVEAGGCGPVAQSNAVGGGETSDMASCVNNAVVVAHTAVHAVVETEHVATTGLIHQQVVVEIEVGAVFLHENVDVLPCSSAFQRVMGKVDVVAVVVVDGKGVAVGVSLQVDDVVADDDVVGFCSYARADSEHRSVTCGARDVHHIVLEKGTVVALEAVNGIVIGFKIVGIDNGVATNDHIIVKSRINRLKLLIFKVATLDEKAFVELVHILTLDVERDAAVHELATNKLGVVVDPSFAVVHVDKVLVVIA